jgi:hypothetical protein
MKNSEYEDEFEYSFLPLAAKARMWAYLNPTS